MVAKKYFKIFVLDTNMFSMNIYHQHLTNLGYADVTAFNSPENCLAALPQQPDIVFVDHSANREKEVDIVQKIKRSNPDIYVVFISSLENTDAVITSLKNGAFEFIIRDDNEVKSIDNVIMKVYRVKSLLEKNMIGFTRKMV